MDIILKTGFQKINHDIHFQPQTMLKGKMLVQAKHVRDVEEYRRNHESYLIKSRIIRQASVHETPYITTLKINALRYVIDVQCNCVYNQSKKCKHVAALIYYVNNEESVSKTSVEQQWGKPSARQFAKNKYSKGEYFENMVPHKYIKLQEPQEVQISELVSDSPLKQILMAQSNKSNFQTIRNIMNSLLTQVEFQLEIEDCAECIRNFLIFCDEHSSYTRDYNLDVKLKDFYVENVILSEKSIVTLGSKTLKQSLCNDWYKARRLRISASTNVHRIKTLTRKSASSLVLNILNPIKIDCASMRYGLKHESDAKEKYEEMYKCTVKRVGVVVSKTQPWLCASLDGVVVEDGCLTKIVEFKCPSSCQKKAIVNYADRSCNVKYLQFIGNKIILKKSDPYYTQTQVQMYVTGMTICDLFIYSPSGSFLIEVHRDEEFLEGAILKSEEFYFKKYLPALFEAVIKEEVNGG